MSEDIMESIVAVLVAAIVLGSTIATIHFLTGG